MSRLLLAPLVIATVWIAVITSVLASARASESFFTLVELQALGFSQYESINPNSLLFSVKQLVEKVGLMLVLDQPKKGQSYADLVDKRFNELVFIVNNQKTGFLDETIGRYNSSVGHLKSNYPRVMDQGNINNKLRILEKLRDRYHSGTGHWVNIQQAVDTTTSLL